MLLQIRKLVLLLVISGGLIIQSSAQTRMVDKSFSIGERESITLDLKFGDLITVRAWDKEEVSFQASIQINSGKLNDALEIDFNRNSGGLKITTDYNEQMLKSGNREDCPGNRYSQFNWNSDGNGSFICTAITYRIFVPEGAHVDIESISSDIELIDLAGPIRAKTISGFVDLTHPAAKDADIDLKTVSGEAYTNLDGLQFENKKKEIPLVGYRLKGKIGTGGHKISLESVSGNIYLRKSQS